MTTFAPPIRPETVVFQGVISIAAAENDDTRTTIRRLWDDGRTTVGRLPDDFRMAGG